MKQDRLGDACLSLSRREPSSGSNAVPKKYEAPTLVKRAVLSAITSEDALQVSGQAANPV